MDDLPNTGYIMLFMLRVIFVIIFTEIMRYTITLLNNNKNKLNRMK